MQRPIATGDRDVSLLLRLPIELRRHIYSYVLPHTSRVPVSLQRVAGEPEKSEYNLTFVRETPGTGTWRMQRTLPKTDRETGNEVVWRRGNIAILAANHQVHEECTDMLYGESLFVIDVAFDSIKFRYRWVVPSTNLTPSRSISFLEHFSQRNLMRIKNYIINVEHVDNYTGMIKYNFGGPGLVAGISQKTEDLANLLSVVPYINRLHVHMIDGAISRVRFPSGRIHRVQDENNYTESEKMLNPFRRLYSVRHPQVTGVSVDFAEDLEKCMRSSRVMT
ncbi:hypothetical protein EJ04DRAFT_541232 [Polyplosphaeria fusca]|uniref:DUF7730 domain-containing protein n=1 Tax=Polyplosphaeria fusca TaxID=682080 RepID=A0A9P4V7K0_9PLEO|nr:hypothetical protein EJ04DRAFT_541232 [Polyplosphaeria fusca]